MPLSLKLRVIEGRYGIARLAPDAPIPQWSGGPGFLSISRADDELTVVCLEQRIPADIESDLGWACLRTVGPFDFQATGIVQTLIQPLSDNGIGVFIVCTFDGEHLLISENDFGKGQALLIAAGHGFVD